MGFFPFSRDLSRTLFLGRMSDVLFMHRFGAFVFLFIPDSVYATVPLRKFQILAGAVIETGDGLCGALLLSLRHLSTSFRTTQAWFRGPLRRDITADRVVYTNIGI